MDKPNIAAKQPAVVELEPGTHAWCRCGLSQAQPFCDGSHREGTAFKSLKFTVEERTKAALCQCKHTNNPPYCDGTHSQLGGDT